MPVVYHAREVDNSPPGRAGCPLCDEPLSFPAVKWVGQLEGQFRRFYFHPECAQKIADQLLADIDGIRRRAPAGWRTPRTVA
jgi:hypothetical protein